jgi:hypothetical protein
VRLPIKPTLQTGPSAPQAREAAAPS